MKKIYHHIVGFIKEDFNPFSYGITAVLMAIFMYFNYFSDYKVGFYSAENRYLHSLTALWQRPVFYGIFYSLAFLMILAIVYVVSDRKDAFAQKKFWFFSFLFLLVLTIDFGFIFDQNLLPEMLPGNRYYVVKILYNAHSLLTCLLPICLIYFICKPQDSPYVFGLTKHNFEAKPYAIMGALMLPLLIWAANQPDFISKYPILKPDRFEATFGLTKPALWGLFELVYLSDFLNIELLFRGAFSIGLYRYLGRHAILPAVFMYMMAHFEKPFAEALGSIFGGYILSVLAVRTQSILGGCFVHMFVALSMDLLAIYVGAYAW